MASPLSAAVEALHASGSTPATTAAVLSATRALLLAEEEQSGGGGGEASTVEASSTKLVKERDTHKTWQLKVSKPFKFNLKISRLLMK